MRSFELVTFEELTREEYLNTSDDITRNGDA
jgi:hypothetical protein